MNLDSGEFPSSSIFSIFGFGESDLRALQLAICQVSSRARFDFIPYILLHLFRGKVEKVVLCRHPRLIRNFYTCFSAFCMGNPSCCGGQEFPPTEKKIFLLGHPNSPPASYFVLRNCFMRHWLLPRKGFRKKSLPAKNETSSFAYLEKK